MFGRQPKDGELKLLAKFKRGASLNSIDRRKWEAILGRSLESAIERLVDFGFLEKADPRTSIERRFTEDELRGLFAPGSVPESAKKAKLVSLVLENADPDNLANILEACAAYRCTPQGTIEADKFREMADAQKRADLRKQTLQMHRKRLDDIKKNAAVFSYAMWVTMDDGRTCPSCEKLDGKFFKSKNPPALPNPHCTCEDGCRCMLIGLTEEDYKDELAELKSKKK